MNIFSALFAAQTEKNNNIVLITLQINLNRNVLITVQEN